MGAKLSIFAVFKKTPYICAVFAGVLELVDNPDLGSGAARRMGSSPFARTSRPLRGPAFSCGRRDSTSFDPPLLRSRPGALKGLRPLKHPLVGLRCLCSSSRCLGQRHALRRAPAGAFFVRGKGLPPCRASPSRILRSLCRVDSQNTLEGRFRVNAATESAVFARKPAASTHRTHRMPFFCRRGK